MAQFLGFVQQETSMPVTFLARNSSGSPANADALPAYRVYGPQGLMQNGTGTAAVKDGTVTGLYGASILCDGADGYAAGTTYAVLVTGAISAVAWGDLLTFTVV